MITAADAHSMTVMTIAENKKKLFKKEIYEIECAISNAINDGLFYTGISVISEPSEIAAVLEKQGFEVTLDSSVSSDCASTFFRISWKYLKTM